jgi:hypothetical protein
MPKTTDSINNTLYDLLKTQGFNVKMYASDGNSVPVAQEADVFQFEFVDDGDALGTVTVTIDGLYKLVVYYNDEIFTKDGGQRENWIKFVKLLKKFAQRNQLGFELSNLDNLQTDMTKREHSKKLEEGYYGTRQTSYSDSGPSTVKMIIKHNKSLSETDARYRYIQKIFLENEQGERVLVPSTKPSIGRVFARHLAENGQYNDERWHHIVEITEDISNLSGFVRATRNRQFNESAEQIVSEATQYYTKLKETIKRLQSHRGYNKYFESWKPTLNEVQSTDRLSEMFQSSSIDPRIERALPVLGKLNVYISEAPDISVFEDWADNILDEALKPTLTDQKEDLIGLLDNESEFMALGPDASNSIGELTELIENPRLYQRLRSAAKLDPNRDARPIVIAWMSEQPGGEYTEILNQIQKQDRQDDFAKPESNQDQIDVNVDIDDEQTETDDIPPPVREESDILRLRKLSGL